MSSTTINRAQTVATTNPFAAAIMEATEREARATAEAAQVAEANRIEREAKKAQFAIDRQKAIDRQRALEIISWVGDYFFLPVARLAISKGWKPAAIAEAQAYCEALVRQSDVELPAIDPGIEKQIRSRFAFALAMDSLTRKVIEPDKFAGQRQEWFTPLFAQKLNDAERVLSLKGTSN